MNVDRQELSVARYNEILRSPIVLSIFRYFARINVQFSSLALIDHFSKLENFPLFSARTLLAASEVAGVALRGEKVNFVDIDSCTPPFLTYVESADPGSDQVQLMEILSISNRGATIASGAAGSITIGLKKLREIWTGVVFSVKEQPPQSGLTELDVYRSQVRTLPGFIPPSSCASIISYCERQVFRRSRVTTLEKDAGVKNGVDLKARNSSSAILLDRQEARLAEIYRRVSELESVDDRDIEFIQCVRYKTGQKFCSHFDSGNGVDRKTTYLLYLNDDFAGGETWFPMLDLGVKPRTGECLQFPDCDKDGRILWQSEHIGTAVTSGVKYALNVWVRRPPLS